MTAIVLKTFDYRKQILAMLIVAFLALVLGAFLATRHVSGPTIPLNPCKTCAGACACPRLAGSIRCGCPQ